MQEFNPYAPSQVAHQQAPANPGESVPLTPRAYKALTGSKIWVRIISIMFFVLAAISIIAQIVQMNATRPTPTGYSDNGIAYQTGANIGSIIGLLIVLTIFVLLGLRLHTYAKSIGLYSVSKNSQDLDKAMESQTKFWRLVGILTIIYLTIILGALLLGAVL